MDADARGPLLYSYFPIPANPMSVALLLLLLVVTFVLGPIAAAPEGLWPLGGTCFLPLAAVLLAMALAKPSPTFVHEEGIEISQPLAVRILRRPRYVPWSEVRDVYPASYEVSGSFLSPFASSAGTLVHVGIGLETRDGRRGLVRCRFHPDRHASLSIDLDRGLFNCFGCGVHGDAIEFEQRIKGLNFKQAVQLMAGVV